MPVRSSISMRISLNSCSLKPCPAPWRSLMVITLLPHYGGRFSLLPNRSHRDWAVHFLRRRATFRICTELCQSLVQLVGKLYELADRCDGAARALGRLARDIRDDL